MVTGFYCKRSDSLCWRIKYLQQIKLNSEEQEYPHKELYHDSDKINYLD